MKLICVILGCISLLLGAVGLVVPLLPTTPFVLLSAALFFRSSPRLYTWLIESPRLGKYIRNYRENKEIPIKAKVTSITLLWLSIGYCILVVAQGKLWLQATLLAIAIGVTLHLLSLGTTPPKR
ncbi:MAG: YbaN family protein [Rikenellaceae bacterium]